MMFSCLFTNNFSNRFTGNSLDTVNVLNLTNCNFSADTISMGILMISTFSLTIFLYLMAFFTREEERLYTMQASEDLNAILKDPKLRFYATFSAPSTVRFFLIASQLYLVVIFLCLLNYFLNSCVLLYISLSLLLITLIFVVFIFIIVLVKATMVTTKEYEEFLSAMNWLKGEHRAKDAQNKRKKL